jgi:transcription elongation factor GreA
LKESKSMADQPIYVTREGLKKLEEELEYLRTVKRAEVAQRLHDAMGEGDIDENAEYDDAKNEQSFVEGRILTLETMIKNAVIIQQEGRHRDQVVLGSTVTVVEDGGEPETYHIVGSAEADPRQGRISNESPLGRALLGKRVGDSITINAPAGTLSFRIVSIR